MGGAFLLLYSVIAIVNAQSQTTSQPNIIFILTDDMGYGDISCFNGTYPTPNIDKMASEGTKFANYYSASPICSPSRVGFLTGMSPTKWNITSYLQTKMGTGKASVGADGVEISHILRGAPAARNKTMYWEYGRNDTAYNYPQGKDRSPALAIREGKWKLLMNKDKSGLELYDMGVDKNETNNIAAANEKWWCF